MAANGAPVDPNGSAVSRLHDKKLVSWKEIAVHLGREIRTVQRWEKTEGLPVRRHEHQKRSTVYAYAIELEEWFKKRQRADDPDADCAFVRHPDVAEVATDSDNGNASLSAHPSFAAAEHLAGSRARVPAGSTWKQLAKALAAVAAILIIAYAVFRWIQPNAFLQKKVRLVVIPFTNLSR